MSVLLGLGAKAERKLLANLRARVESAGDTITGNTTVTSLGKIWTESLQGSDDHTEQTLERYESIVEKIIGPALGEYLIIEATVSRVDQFLRALAGKTPGRAKTTKSVLTSMFDLAVRHDALRTNPVREVRLPARKRKPVKALTIDEASELREGLRKWQGAEGVKGPRRSAELLDVVDVMLGTGMRIGEVLALRWSDVDLGDHPSLTVTGTLVPIKDKGLNRQGHAKTASGYRVLTLPTFVVDVLLRRSVEALPTETNAVFPSGAGTWKWPNNYRRSLRAALKELETTTSITPARVPKVGRHAHRR
ncbi:tyrosine-type recombinase/integrase [Brevibacterium permense]|uniref:Integrase n=1 Tax=Brevibacterium permense TaxID=234834 RepID=A0ABN2AQQ8_9MICO|nr:tyrosine-type recombinase/integrase [Brevibacterium permense]